MPQFDIVIRSRSAVTPQGVRPAAIGVRDGCIEALGDYGAAMEGLHETDLGNVAVLPGCVDLDVAVQAPGQSLADAYARTGAAAVCGGVTSIVAAPAPARPAVTGTDALRAHREAAAGCPVQVAFLGGIAPHSSGADLADLQGAGVVGFSCSLSDGGGPDITAVDDARLRRATAQLAVTRTPLLVHSEDAGELGPAPGTEGRPPRAERRGLERIIAAARVCGARVHVSPFTAAECAALLDTARSIGVPLSAHTCPHYLCLPAEQLPAGAPAPRCRPPLRSNANRAALWSVLLSGGEAAITTIGSGHRPADGMYTISWTLPALWTAAARRGLGLAELARWTAQEPARLAGLAGKGRIAVGQDADLAAFDGAAHTPVPADDPGPYAGRTLQGRVVGTWIAGRRVLGGDPAADPVSASP